MTGSFTVQRPSWARLCVMGPRVLMVRLDRQSVVVDVRHVLVQPRVPGFVQLVGQAAWAALVGLPLEGCAGGTCPSEFPGGGLPCEGQAAASDASPQFSSPYIACWRVHGDAQSGRSVDATAPAQLPPPWRAWSP